MNPRIALLVLTLAFLPGFSRAASQNPADLPAGRYVLDAQHASVLAKVMHLGVSLFTVRFDRFDGAFTYDPAHPEAASVQASVDATSLDAGGPYSRKFADNFLDARAHIPPSPSSPPRSRRTPTGAPGP